MAMASELSKPRRVCFYNELTRQFSPSWFGERESWIKKVFVWIFPVYEGK